MSMPDSLHAQLQEAVFAAMDSGADVGEIFDVVNEATEEWVPFDPKREKDKE